MGFNFVFCSAEYDLDHNIQVTGFYGTAKKDGEYTAAFLVPENEFGASVANAEGTFQLDNGVLTIHFDKMELYGNAYPAGFSKLFVRSDDLIITKMPFNLFEISLFDIAILNDFPQKLEEMLGTPTSSVKKPWVGNENYFEIKYDGIAINAFENSYGNYGFISRIEITRPNLSLCREIKIGDSIDSVISKFPSPENRIENGYEDGRDARVLYGKIQHMETGGFIVSEGDKPVKIMYLDRGVLLEFDFDDNAKVNKIVYAREG